MKNYRAELIKELVKEGVPKKYVDMDFDDGSGTDVENEGGIGIFGEDLLGGHDARQQNFLLHEVDVGGE